MEVGKGANDEEHAVPVRRASELSAVRQLAVWVMNRRADHWLP
jgi:hypothetical protein